MPRGLDPAMFPHARPVVPASGRSSKVDAARVSPGPKFDEVLQKRLSDLKFSAHAQQRMALRGIRLTAEDQARLREAVNKAEAKGARDSLILLRDMAFVVSVRNRTVITALDAQSLRENVFTNIDSAVVM